MNVGLTTCASMLALMIAATPSAAATAGSDVSPPPNAPARVEYDTASGALVLHYHGARILRATVTPQAADGTKIAGAVKMASPGTSDDKVEQRLTFTLVKPQKGVTLVLQGTITASECWSVRRPL